MAGIMQIERARREQTDELRNYSDIVTQALVDAAADSRVDAYISALETAAGLLSRAFAAARPEGPGASLFSAWTLAQIGRALIEDGEAVWFRIGMDLIRAQNYDFLPPRSYSITNPDGLRRMNANRVLHVRWNLQVASGRGLGPLDTARTLRLLMQRLENSLSEEAQAATGYLLPIPTDGQSDTVESLRKDIASLKGRIAVIETSRTGWGEGPRGATRDFALQRMGPSYPADNVNMYETARRAVLTACGTPVSLAESADAGAQREAWRRYLHGTVAPLGRFLEEEAARIGLPVRLRWDDLFASDISGRARAFQSMVGGGMDPARAAALSGLIAEDD